MRVYLDRLDESDLSKNVAVDDRALFLGVRGKRLDQRIVYAQMQKLRVDF